MEIQGRFATSGMTVRHAGKNYYVGAPGNAGEKVFFLIREGKLVLPSLEPFGRDDFVEVINGPGPIPQHCR